MNCFVVHVGSGRQVGVDKLPDARGPAQQHDAMLNTNSLLNHGSVSPVWEANQFAHRRKREHLGKHTGLRGLATAIDSLEQDEGASAWVEHVGQW
jgi:hypothetical protein